MSVTFFQIKTKMVCGLFTARKRSRGKVMLLHLSVILFTGMGVYPSMQLGRGGLCDRGRGGCDPHYGQQAGGMHPTGMLSF